VKVEKSHRIARLVLGVEAFRERHYAEAEEHFSAARDGPISDLTTNLSRAWVQLAAKRPDAAFTTLAGMKKAEWALFYQRYHTGLIADLAKRPDKARKAYEQAFAKNKRTLRIAEAYARHLAAHGDTHKAAAVIRKHIASATSHPISRALLKQLEAGKNPGLLVTDPIAGMAEVYYGIGDALTGEGGVEIGTIYLQLALRLKPDFPLALRSLGEVYDAAKRYDLAIEAYNRVPRSSPLWLTVQIRKAYDLNSLERVDDAVALLNRLASAFPDEVRPLEAMGGILRAHKRYREAVDAYSRAIKLVGKPKKSHWALYYARGVCFERLHQWPKAEADLKRAMQLDGDRALVLNYLGYSWVDQGQNLEEALKLIRRAVRLKPGDGYFVDSLGWAYYRLGRFKDAARELERAVELRPDDPVINDHLGDAYWRVGRRQEARYQWAQALTLEPEPKDAEKIKLKLAKGLDAVTEGKAVADDAASKQTRDN
ncbi:MAG: tetratricopeptide repeat protein, partial [Alphaproteobacteria bacterium]